MFNNYSKYLIISDLDGTLINSQHFISQENLDAISFFIKNGGSFAIATGRSKDNIRPYIENLTLNGPCILYNGGGIYNFQEERFLATELMDKNLVEEYIIYCMKNYKNMVVEIFTPDMLYIITPDHILDPYVEREKQVYLRTTLDEVMKKDWIKVLIYDSPESLQKAQSMLKNYNFLDKVDSFFSQVFYLELIKKGISKGAALEKLKNSNQYSDKTIIAVGDYDNDVEMISSADVGIAVSNARECVKDVADIVTVSNDENALYDIIYNIIPSMSHK